MIVNFTKFNLVLSFFFTSLFAVQANAFYYEEHKLITQEALTLTQDTNSLLIDQYEIKTGMGSNFLCDDLLNPAPEACFTLADFPALAGDHAGSPMLMQWKWLNDEKSRWRLFFPMVDLIALLKVFSEKGCSSSETTISNVPNRKSFAKLMHKNPEAKSFASDFIIPAFDSNYGRSAGHNCNHFRNKDMQDFEIDAVKSETFPIWKKPWFVPDFIARKKEAIQKEYRERERPNQEAAAWYAQLHATALELASLPGRNNLAAAWLFETFALHYLQDGVSAGHIISPSNGGREVITATKPEHDELSKNGLKVSFEMACNTLNNLNENTQKKFSSLLKECETTPYEAKIFGDKMLTAKGSETTKDLAVFISYISLKEFGDALTAKTPILPSQDLEENFESDPHWTFQGMENNKLAETLFIWWESGGRADASSPMELAAKEYLKVNKIEALKLWPIAVTNDAIAQQ